MTALLQIRGLVKRFGGLNAVDGVDLDVEPGEILSVIGPNGAGKTTLFNVVTGLYSPDGGSIRFDGHNLVGLKPSQICGLGIARTFQTVRLFANMSVLENAMVGQHSRSRSGVLGAVLRLPRTRAEERRVREQARSALGFFGSRLASYREEQPAFMLSYANRRRLEIARAMATNPKLILLDEPTAGMNPRETEEMTRLIGKLRDERGFTSRASRTGWWRSTTAAGSRTGLTTRWPATSGSSRPTSASAQRRRPDERGERGGEPRRRAGAGVA